MSAGISVPISEPVDEAVDAKRPYVGELVPQPACGHVIDLVVAAKCVVATTDRLIAPKHLANPDRSPTLVHMIRRLATVFAGLVLLAACAPSATPTAPPPALSQATSSSSPEPKPEKVATATELANQIKAKIKSVTKIVTLTEKNDPNDQIGSPNGYTDGAIIYDSGAQCTELGTKCGAMIEIWPSVGQARVRSESYLKFLKAAPMLGREYHTLNRTALLRVTGKINPSVARSYAAAFTG